jgi:hypothetical protein
MSELLGFYRKQRGPFAFRIAISHTSMFRSPDIVRPANPGTYLDAKLHHHDGVVRPNTDSYPA